MIASTIACTFIYFYSFITVCKLPVTVIANFSNCKCMLYNYYSVAILYLSINIYLTCKYTALLFKVFSFGIVHFTNIMLILYCKIAYDSCSHWCDGHLNSFSIYDTATAQLVIPSM